MEDMLTTEYDGCGCCLVAVRRLSRKTDKTNSPERQGNQILAATGDVGGHIIAWADDWEVSGATEPLTRSGFGPWLRGEMGPYDGVVSASVDRVGRNVRDTLSTLIGQLQYAVGGRHQIQTLLLWDLEDNPYGRPRLADARTKTVLDVGPHERAVVEFNLCLVWALLGREPDAMHWLALSLKSAEQAIETFAWSLRAYIEDSRQGRKKRSRLEKVIDFLEENLLFDVRDSIRDPVVTAVQVSIEVAVDLVDRSQSTTIMERIKVLDNYIKFYNLVQYSMTVSHGRHNPDYLELYDTYLQRAFNGDINHYASLDDWAPRKCLQLRNVQGTS